MPGYPNANFANDANGRNSIVNGQWLIVMPGYPNANFANGANGRSTYHVPGMTIDN